MLHHTFRRQALVLAVAGSTALFAQGAFAQSDITNLGIEEIVVTAQKRSEDVQSVPISISALSESDMERRGFNNAQDLINTVPNLAGFASPGARSSTAINMRGVGGGAPANLSNDPGVAIYIDGVVLGKQIGNTVDVAELERVEVLRGPQGTLYGRNSTGGTINFITKKPTGEFGGKLTGTVGSDGLWGLRAHVDTATLGTPGEGAGTLKANFSAQTRERDGLYGEDANGGQEFDGIDRQAYRVALRWEPNEAVTIDYAYDKTKLDEENTPQFLVGLTPLAVNPATGAFTDRMAALNGYIQAGEAAQNFGAGPLAAAAADPTFQRWLDSVRATRDVYSNLGSTDERPGNGVADAESYTASDASGHSLTGTLDVENLGFLGDVQFKSITGWRKVDNRNVGDLDGVDNTVAPGGAGAVNDSALGAFYSLYDNIDLYPAFLRPGAMQGTAKLWDLIDQLGAGYGFRQDAAVEYSQFSQEVQMVGTTDRVQYALGFYYFEDEGSFDNYRIAAAPVGGILTSAYDNETEATAFYGQATWTPPVLDDKLDITVGLRHTEETKGVEYLYTDDGASSGTGLFSGSPLNLRVNLNYTGAQVPMATYGDDYDADFSNNSGNLTVAYRVTDDTNAYVRWATGYRSGGFNGEIYNNPVEEETIESWELGVKSDIVPGVVRLNASIFAYTFEDMQVAQIKVSPTGQPTSLTTNAGKAERWGSEVELQWSPTDSMLLAFAWAHMDGDFEEYPILCGTGSQAATCIDTSNLAERSASPDDQLSLIGDWVFLKTDMADFMTHVEVFWQDETPTSALWTNNYTVGTANTPSAGTYPVVYDPIMLEDRVIVNARLGIENVELGGGTLRASLWSQNLLDEEYNAYGINFGGLGVITAQYGPPRTYGLDVIWEF